MKFYKLILLSLTITFFFACQNEKGSSIMGYNYTVHNATGGERPVEGDWVYFGLVVTDEKDSVIQDMSNQAQLPSVQILPDAEIEKSKNPVLGVLKNMSVGDKATIFMPIDSFKNAGIDLSQFEEIRYKITLEKILSEEEYKAEMDAKKAEMQARSEEIRGLLPEVTENVEEFLTSVKNGSADLQQTDSGLQYKIIEKGDGSAIEPGSNAEVLYYGALMDGEPFDNSYKRGSPFRLTVGVGQVISGWDEGLQLLNEGGEAFFVIPSDLAYGATGSGSIPADATIMFHVKVESVY